jgi:hypothetical protein
MYRHAIAESRTIPHNATRSGTEMRLWKVAAIVTTRAAKVGKKPAIPVTATAQARTRSSVSGRRPGAPARCARAKTIEGRPKSKTTIIQLDPAFAGVSFAFMVYLGKCRFCAETLLSRSWS